MNFTWDAVGATQNAYDKLKNLYREMGEEIGTSDENYVALFKGFINDDLDTPKALALMWELLKDTSVESKNKKATLLRFDEVLGLGLKDIFQAQDHLEIPENIKSLIQEREKARSEKDFKKSDELRDKIKELGYEVKDTEQGPKISIKK